VRIIELLIYTSKSTNGVLARVYAPAAAPKTEITLLLLKPSNFGKS